MSSPSLRSCVSAGTGTKLSRSAAEGVAHSLAQHLNHVLNRTVSDSHLSVSSIVGHGEKFQLARLVERLNVPLQLRGTTACLFVRLLVVVEDGRPRKDLPRLIAGEPLSDLLIRRGSREPSQAFGRIGRCPRQPRSSVSAPAQILR